MSSGSVNSKNLEELGISLMDITLCGAGGGGGSYTTGGGAGCGSSAFESAWDLVEFIGRDFKLKCCNPECTVFIEETDGKKMYSIDIQGQNCSIIKGKYCDKCSQ